jgi:hypothetical protein
MTVIDVARRIQRAHNRLIPPEEIGKPGGTLAFSATGTFLLAFPAGVATMTALCHCPEHEIAVLFPRRTHRVSRDEVVAFLEALQGIATQRDTASLYGSTPRRPVEELVQ